LRVASGLLRRCIAQPRSARAARDGGRRFMVTELPVDEGQEGHRTAA
jgi:hypothetical protein